MLIRIWSRRRKTWPRTGKIQISPCKCFMLDLNGQELIMLMDFINTEKTKYESLKVQKDFIFQHFSFMSN